MDFLELIKVILLGIIEGITEWLPVSSSGHILLFDAVWGLNQTESFKEIFLYFVQAGAILAVIFLFFPKLCPFKLSSTDAAGANAESGAQPNAPIKRGLYSDKRTWLLWAKIAVACIPAAVVGLLVDMPDHPAVIAVTLILYGIAFLFMESRERKEFKVNDVHDISWVQALIIGGAQVLSIIPGTSRSGVTILAALLLGISRPAGAEFTFFLAIPVMLGASLLKIIKNLDAVMLFGVEWIYLLAGFTVAFAVSMLCIKLLMRFVQKHDFKVFGWYRIALGLVVLGVFILPLLFS